MYTSLCLNWNPLTRSSQPPLSFHQLIRWFRNINLMSIGYAYQPHLRTRLTQGGRPFPWKPQAFDGQDSHLSFRYSHRHTHCLALQQFFRSTFNALSTLPYQLVEPIPQFRYYALAPIHFRRRIIRLVSYYALFKGWLLLSQPPSCLNNSTSFPTQHRFRDLNWRSGLFPF